MLCETCYDQVITENWSTARNYVADHEALFDTICPGCIDINRPLIDDMLGSSEEPGPPRPEDSTGMSYRQSVCRPCPPSGTSRF